MNTFTWIVVQGLLMSLIALIGSVTLLIKETTLKKILLPLVALAAGTLLGGAFFHLIPSAVEEMGNTHVLYFWVVMGFVLFFVLEQFLHWHHCHRTTHQHHEPITYLILIADGLHNFIGGMAVAGSFIIDIRLGIAAWIAAAAHEIPQELGDFGILVHGGWSRKKALIFNFISALTFPLGSILAYFVSFQVDVSFLLPFAAGNFIYIAAVDLVPEINKHKNVKSNIVHFTFFVVGIALIFILSLIFEH